MLHDSFLDLTSGPIGRVVTSEESPATAHEFFFWTAETEAAQNLDIGHIVAAESEDATAVAVLDDPRRYSDLQSFLDDFYAFDGDPSLEALSERVEILVFKARVLATKHRHERKKSKRPVRTGPVFFATSAAIEYALGTEDFAGHNIPGMSGLSTKTSHALFTIASTFQTVEDKKVAALMFNVKGADLLFLDKPVEVSAEDDPELAERYKRAGQRGLPPEDREMYESLGIEVRPFENLRIFAPLTFGGDPQASTVYPADIQAKKLNTRRRAWGEDSCVYPIVWDLEDVLPHAGRIFDPTDYDDKFKGFVEYLRAGQVRTMRRFHAEIDEAFAYFEESESSYWNGHHQATVAKVRNRFGVLPRKCGGLLVDGEVDYGDLPQVDGSFEDREMRVVDISQLSGVPQDLVVTKVINSVGEMAEQNRLGVDKLIIFVDELNKYAPSGSRISSLKDTLVDIAARGRHLHLTLFGAQQFRSRVDDEVVGNAATSLYGRIGDEELTNSSYRSFSGTTREELLQLEKGRLLLRHAHYAVPIFGTFPRPMVLMGKQGTDIFGEQEQDPASSVLAVMRKLTAKPPAIIDIRSEIEGVPEEQVYEALGAVQAAHRTGNGAADPYKNFRWNLKRPARTGSGRRDASRILSGLDRMRD